MFWPMQCLILARKLRHTVKLPPMKENALVKLAVEGDKAAFAILMLKYQGRISNVVSRYANNQSEIFDISQESFFKAYKAMAGFRGESSFYTWLYRIAMNTAKNNLERKKMRFVDVDVNAVDVRKTPMSFQSSDFSPPEEVLIQEELGLIISQAIEQLPEKLRTPFILFENEGHSYIEIAQIMSCPIGTVRSRLYRARKKIESQLEK